MKTYTDPRAELERQLEVLNQEINGMHRDLRRVLSLPSSSAIVQIRRAQRAQLIREQLDWLIPIRDRMAAELEVVAEFEALT